MNQKRVVRPIILALVLSLCASGLQAAEPTRLRVTAEVANIRQMPDIGSVIVQQAPKDAILTALRREGDWYFVEFVSQDGSKASGYVHVSLVSAAEPQVPEEPVVPPRTETVKPPPAIVPPVEARRPETSSFSVDSWESRFSFSLLGGGAYVFGGDLNEAAQGLADYYRDYLGAEVNRTVTPAHFGYAFGGEVLILLADHLSLGFGGGYLHSHKQSLLILQKGNVKHIYNTRPEFGAIPVRVFFSYTPVPLLSVRLGVEYLFATAGYYYRTEVGSEWREWEGEAKAQGLGIIGGLSLEWPFSRNIGFVVDLGARYAPLAGFEGTGTYLDSTEASATEKGKMYYYEVRDLAGNAYPLVYIRNKIPSEAGVFSPRDAEVDFTGVTLRAGLKFKF